MSLPGTMLPETAAYTGPSMSTLLDALHDALVTERRLLDDLIAQTPYLVRFRDKLMRMADSILSIS